MSRRREGTRFFFLRFVFVFGFEFGFLFLFCVVMKVWLGEFLNINLCLLFIFNGIRIGM